jgi:uncharacterized membrane protein
MANYFIIGGDGKQYGPITTDDLLKWIAEGRLNAESRAKEETDTEWRALAAFPEFAEALGAQAPATGVSSTSADSAGWQERDYELDIGGCISRGWELVKNNMSLLVVGVLLYLLMEIAIAGLANIPLIGPIFSIANFVISGPLMGGVYYLFIRVIRNEPASVGEIFAGFRRAFGQLFLATLVQGLLIGMCMIPFLIVFIWKFIPLAGHLQHGSPPDRETVAAIESVLITCLPVLLLCAIPATYLGACWKFTLPLIVDRQMNFTAAMKASWKMVNKHWWQIFGLVILISLLNIAGVLACCIGLFFTIPIGIAALMIAYETIFSVGQNH